MGAAASFNRPPRPEKIQGVSLAFLQNLVEREKIEASTTTAKVVETFVKPSTKVQKCSFIDALMSAPKELRTDERSGASYFGNANCMISHAWRCPFRALVDCIASHVETLNVSPQDYYVVLDIFTINQHKMAHVSEDTDIYDSLVERLKLMVTDPSDNVLVLALDSWERPTLLERAWCLFEIAVATRSGVRVVGSLPPSQKHSMYSAMTKKFDAVEDHFTNIDVRNADATVASDKEFILGIIRDLKLPSATKDDTYAGFNELLQGVMRKWLATIHTHDVKIRPALAKQRVQKPFVCASATSMLESSEKAVEAVLGNIEHRLGIAEPTCLIIRCTVAHDIKRLLEIVRARFPKALLHGCTSSKGVMGAAGAAMSTYALSIFAISDPGGIYRLVSGDNCDDAEAVETAVRKAVASVDVSSPPELCFSSLSPGPGNEERVLAALQKVVGECVAVFGGSSADDTLEGKWSQISGETVTSSGFALLLMWPTVEVFVRLSSLHARTEKSGIVTKVAHYQADPKPSDPARTILEIDGKAASEVYNAWTNGAILKELGGESLEGNVLSASTNFPIGKLNPNDGGISLVHPANVRAEDGAMDVFADVKVHDKLVCMNAETDRLVDSVGGVVQSALRISRFDSKLGGELLGAYVVYCGGMMLRVGKRIHDVAKSIDECLGDVRGWAGCFTFGEQGPVACGGGGGMRNAHGNLMMNILLFGRTQLALKRTTIVPESK